MVQWPMLNNSHAYPFCKTTPGTTSYLVLAIAPFLSVKLAEIGRETIQSVKVRVHHTICNTNRSLPTLFFQALARVSAEI